MKKLLSLLSVLTISGTAVPATIAASSYEKQLETNTIVKDHNYSLELLSRNKRGNNNELETWYCFLCHDRLVAKISNDTWSNIAFNHDIKLKSEFYNYVFLLINNFQKRNSSGDSLSRENYWQDDVIILANTIVDHFENINQVFLNKHDNSKGLFIRTNRDSYWVDNDNFWGAHVNNE